LADGDEGEEEGRQASETPRHSASKKAKCLTIYACKGEANDYLEVKFGIDEGEVIREAGYIVGEPSNEYAAHE
jgi:hypothetical protein